MLILLLTQFYQRKLKKACQPTLEASNFYGSFSYYAYFLQQFTMIPQKYNIDDVATRLEFFPE